METTFTIKNDVIHRANAVVTVVIEPDKYQIHISKSFCYGQTAEPIICKTREEFAKRLASIMFGDFEDKRKLDEAQAERERVQEEDRCPGCGTTGSFCYCKPSRLLPLKKVGF